MSFINDISEGTKPGRPDLYIGTQPGGNQLSSNYAPIRTTPGKMANARIVANYNIREWEMKCHEGITPGHPVFLLKKTVDPEDYRQSTHVYDVFNLPTFNYILATRELERARNGSSPITPREVLDEYTFLGVNNSDQSEVQDAQANGITHSVTISGESIMLNVFNEAPQGGLHLFFIIKAVQSITPRSYVFNNSKTISDQVPITVINSDTGKTIPLTNTLQAVPYACISKTPPLSALKYTDRDNKERIGRFMRVGQLLEGMYFEERNVVNDSEYIMNRADDINEAVKITVALNP